MNVNLLFIMMCIDKYIEILYKQIESSYDVQVMNDVHDYFYDFLVEFNSNKFNKFENFGRDLLTHSLSGRFYPYCSGFNRLYDKKLKALKKCSSLR